MGSLFLSVMTDALVELGPEPSGEAVADWIQRAAALFSRLEGPGRKTLTGLWGELLVISALGDTTLLTRRWHADPLDRFDFLSGNFALEVKSCQDLDRVHHFSLGQLRPPADLEVWLASVVVRQDPKGASALELLEWIEARTSEPDVRAALRAMVFTIGGTALADDDQHRFDAAGARSTLKIMNIRAVPAIDAILPAEVLDVTMRVRCRDVPNIGSAMSDVLARLA